MIGRAWFYMPAYFMGFVDCGHAQVDFGPSPKKRTCKKCGIIRSHKEAARWEERVSTAEKKKSQL